MGPQLSKRRASLTPCVISLCWLHAVRIPSGASGFRSRASGIRTATYPFGYRSVAGVWLIFLIGYFHFFVACIVVLWIKSLRNRIIAVSSLYAVAIAMNLFGFGIMGWSY